MSAFQVSEAHLGAIVRFQFDNDPSHEARWHGTRVDASYARTIISDLGIENWKSVSFRYPNDKEQAVLCTRPLSAYRKLTPLEALKAIACYRYQTCEHPEWTHDNTVWQFIDRVQQTAIWALPGIDQAAGWSLEEDEVSA
jgi:hypothetical protein